MKIVVIYAENMVNGDVVYSADKVGWTDKRQENRDIPKREGGQKVGATQEGINHFLETMLIQKIHFKSF